MASCLEKDMLRHTDSYLILSQNGAQRVHTLCCCQHRTWIRCNATFLVQHLQNPMDEVNQQMLSNPIYASLMTLTEFSRVVIACEKLNAPMLQSQVADSGKLNGLGIATSPLFYWGSQTPSAGAPPLYVAKSTWQDTAPTERIDEVNFSETYRFSWEGLQSLVKNMVEVPTVVIPKTAEILLPTCFKELMLKVLQ